MHVAVDVAYHVSGSAFAAAVAFDAPSSDLIAFSSVRSLALAGPYRAGEFYLRELPCLLAVLADIPKIDTVLIDGFVTLGAERRDGLGAHLYRALGSRVPVIGIAKTPFRDMPTGLEVYRGHSRRPLYVTSRGMDEAGAQNFVQNMHGTHRLPTMLVAADRACREARAAGSVT